MDPSPAVGDTSAQSVDYLSRPIDPRIIRSFPERLSAEANALLADEDVRPRNQPDLVLSLEAE